MFPILEMIEKDVNARLDAGLVSSRILLDRLNLLDDSSRKTSQYQDPNYLPFYYHLSKSVKPGIVFNFGLDLGLPLCCFLTGSPSAERVLAFQKRDASYYSPRIALLNIKKVRPSGISVSFHVGSPLDEAFESMVSGGFDLALITCRLNDEDLNDILYVSWEHMNFDGLLVVDHMKSDPKSFGVFKSFCKSQSRDYVFFNTRYGNAIVRK